MERRLSGPTYLLLMFATVALLALCLIPVSSQKAEAASGYDTTAPLITDVQISTDSLTKPASFTLTFSFIEEDTGVSRIATSFYGDEKIDINDVNNSIYSNQDEGFSSPLFTGKASITFSVSTKCPSEVLHIGQIDIYDKQGNHRMYWMGWKYGIDGNGAYIAEYANGDGDSQDDSTRCYISNQNTIAVNNEFDVAFQKYITNPSIEQNLKDMDDGQTGLITFESPDFMVKKEWFEAIRGTDKRMVLSNEAIQWVFEGKDITNASKDIDIKTSVGLVNGAEYGSDDRAVRLEFADNGILPGKAQIRLKSDYLYNTAGVAGTVYVYYVDKGGLDLESSTRELVLDGTDKWCHFDVTHNSKFVLSPKKLNSTLVGTTIGKISSAKKALTIKWKKQSGKIGAYRITGYQVKYSTKANMKSSKTKTAKGYKKTSLKVKKLKACKKYYIQVRTYMKVGSKTYYSPWSKTAKAKTK